MSGIFIKTVDSDGIVKLTSVCRLFKGIRYTLNSILYIMLSIVLFLKSEKVVSIGDIRDMNIYYS